MIPLFKPYMPELPMLDEILHSGSLAYGKYTKLFEQELCKYFSNNHIIVTNSFNMAVSVTMSVLNLDAGDEIIASPMACLASTQPYADGNRRIVWADVDNHLGTLDPDDVRKRITAKTKAIVHNHFCGYPGYIDEINAIGKEYGIPVIDDGIECFGTEYKGRKIGSCGTDITIFSLTAVRLMNTIDGGIIIFADDNQFKKSILVRDCGIDRQNFRDDLGEINPLCDITLRGYSATMSNVNGYIGAMQLMEVDQLIEKQRRNAQIWDQRISDWKGCKRIESVNGKPNYWVYGVYAEDKRTSLEDFRSKGYYASGVHINNNIYSYFRNKCELSGVTDFYNHFLALPCGWWFENG